MEEILKGRRKKMKEELIEKRIIEGIGNIYVWEEIWRKGI